MMFEKMVRIPHDRIAVLIGKHGAVKSEIEKKCGIVIRVDGETGEVLVTTMPSPPFGDQNSKSKSSDRLLAPPGSDHADQVDDYNDVQDNHHHHHYTGSNDTQTATDHNDAGCDAVYGNNNTDSGHGTDLFAPFKAVEIVVAIGRGFSPEVAMTLLCAENSLHVINLVDYAGKSKSNIERIKGRIIGERGRARRNMEDLSGTRISVYGKTVSIIGAGSNLRRAVDAVDAISEGRMHGAVYSRLESANRRQKQERMILWEKSGIASPSGVYRNSNGW